MSDLFITNFIYWTSHRSGVFQTITDQEKHDFLFNVKRFKINFPIFAVGRITLCQIIFHEKTQDFVLCSLLCSKFDLNSYR